MPSEDAHSPSAPTPDGAAMPETLVGEPLPFGQLLTLGLRPGEQPTLAGKKKGDGHEWP